MGPLHCLKLIGILFTVISQVGALPNDCELLGDMEGYPVSKICAGGTSLGRSVLIDMYDTNDLGLSTCRCKALVHSSSGTTSLSISNFKDLGPNMGCRSYVEVQRASGEKITGECHYVAESMLVEDGDVITMTLFRQPKSDSRYCLSLTLDNLSSTNVTCSNDIETTSTLTTTVSTSSTTPTTVKSSTTSIPTTPHDNTSKTTKLRPTTNQPLSQQPTTSQLTTQQPNTKLPTKTQSITKQPTTTQSITKQPTTTQSITKQTITTQSIIKQPTTTQTITKQPTTTQTITKQPTTTQSITKQPTTTQTITKQPTTTQTITKQPTTTQTITKQPTTSQITTMQTTKPQTTSKEPTQSSTSQDIIMASFSITKYTSTPITTSGTTTGGDANISQDNLNIIIPTVVGGFFLFVVILVIRVYCRREKQSYRGMGTYSNPEYSLFRSRKSHFDRSVHNRGDEDMKEIVLHDYSAFPGSPPPWQTYPTGTSPVHHIAYKSNTCDNPLFDDTTDLEMCSSDGSTSPVVVTSGGSSTVKAGIPITESSSTIKAGIPNAGPEASVYAVVNKAPSKNKTFIQI